MISYPSIADSRSILAILLLDNGANADEVLTVTDRRGTLTNGDLAISTGNGIPRTKQIGAIDYLLRTCNNRHDILDVVDKLLSKMSEVNIKKSITNVFDDSNIEFDLIKKLLTHAEKSGMDVQELINHSDPYTRESAMHILMRSNLTDNITDDLNYLLSKGGDILSKF